MNASNAKVILLTGTPIINYPNEIAILYNMLRGYIKTYHLTLDTSKTDKKIDNEKISKPFVLNKNLFVIKDNAIIKLN